ITNLRSRMVTTHEHETLQRAHDLYAQAEDSQLEYWASRARDEVHWDTPFTQVLDWSNPPFARWFADGTTNACYNAVDRHVAAGNGDRIALYFEGEPGDTDAVTYADLQARVSQTANALESLGVAKGQRVAIYLPMLVEAVVAILACARIGAVHSVVFGGFSAEALRSRIDDAEAKVVITADGSYRRGKPICSSQSLMMPWPLRVIRWNTYSWLHATRRPSTGLRAEINGSTR